MKNEDKRTVESVTQSIAWDRTRGSFQQWWEGHQDELSELLRDVAMQAIRECPIGLVEAYQKKWLEGMRSRSC